jgi:hypothetical protein
LRGKKRRKKSSFPGSVLKITFETAVVELVFSMMVKIRSSFPTLPQYELERRVREVGIEVSINERDNSASEISVIKGCLGNSWK